MQQFFLPFFLFLMLCMDLQAQDYNGSDSDRLVIGLIKQYKKAKKQNDILAFSYLHKALEQEDNISNDVLLKLYSYLGNAYKEQQSYYLSLHYFFKQLEVQNKVLPEESFFIENNIGGAYYFLKNKKKAREYWERALEGFEIYIKKYPDRDRQIEAELIYNNLAVLELEEGNYSKALLMLEAFKKQNIILRDTLNIIMAYENTADAYLKLQQKDKAIENLYTGLGLAKKIQAHYNYAALEVKLGKLYLMHTHTNDSAQYYLQRGFDLAATYNFPDVKLSASEALVDLFEKMDESEKALHYLHIAKLLSEEALSKDTNMKISRLELEHNQKASQQALQLQQKKRERLYVYGLTLFFFSSITVYLMFRLQKSKSEKRQAENRLLAQQLEEKDRVLTGNAISMLQTSEILKTTHKELTELQSMGDAYPTDKMLKIIISDLKKGTLAFNKKEFEKLLTETDGAFYRALLERHPDLTKNEVRLCAFLRMNLSSKEISAITQQSTHSIVVARSRLRKKLNMEEHHSLANYLMQLC